MIKILHTGDIHLDSPFSGVSPRLAEIRRNDLRAAFTSMMTYARMNNVDLMLIAGDVFDCEFVTKETLTLLQKEFETFGKPVFIAPGNHDCASPNSIWMKNVFPQNVHVFTENYLTSVDVASIGVTVYGYAFTEKEMTAPPFAAQTVRQPDRINLLVAHGDMTSRTGCTCPIGSEQLEYFGADYTALGHIHNPPQPGADNRYSYCGCLEPRAFDELGVKGALLVEIDKSVGASTVQIKPIRFSRRRYERGTLVLDGAMSQREINEVVQKYITENHYGEDTLLELRLTGYVLPSLLVDTESMTGEAFGLFMLRVIDDTRPEMDYTALEKDITVRGEVYRQLKGALESPDAREREVGRRALRYAFSALSGDNI